MESKIRFTRVSFLRAIDCKDLLNLEEPFLKCQNHLLQPSLSIWTIQGGLGICIMYIRNLRQHISQTSICSCVRFETIDWQVSNGISCNRGDKGQFILSGEAVTTSQRVTCLHESHVCTLHCQLCLNYSHTRPVFAQCFTVTSFSLWRTFHYNLIHILNTEEATCWIVFKVSNI